MKKNFALILILHSLIAFSQPAYQSVLEGRTAYYQGGFEKQTYAIRIDSTESIPGGKKFYQYRQLNNQSPYCIGTSWIGTEINLLDDGFNLFLVPDDYTGLMDTFWLQTLAFIGESELFYRFFDGTYLTATLASISNDFVIDNFDSVKTYTLQLKNLDASDALSIWNGKEIKLSKTKGLLKFYNFINAPQYSSEVVDLMGLNNPDEGNLTPTAASVFDFEIGDEFQYTSAQPWWFGDFQNNYSKKVVIGKYQSANFDTITYTMSIFNIAYVFNDFILTDTIVTIDTITDKYILPHYFIIDSLPYHFELNSDGGNDYNFIFSGGYKKNFNKIFCGKDLTVVPSYFVGIDSNGCPLDFLCFNSCWVYEFVPHLGIVDYYSADYPEFGRDLVYYKKGNDVCGTPIDFGKFLSVSDAYSAERIRIFPNPASEKISIIFSNRPEEISMIDELGVVRKRITGNEIHNSPLIIDVSDFTRGLYSVVIQFQNTIYNSKILIQF